MAQPAGCYFSAFDVWKVRLADFRLLSSVPGLLEEVELEELRHQLCADTLLLSQKSGLASAERRTVTAALERLTSRPNSDTSDPSKPPALLLSEQGEPSYPPPGLCASPPPTSKPCEPSPPQPESLPVQPESLPVQPETLPVIPYETSQP